MKLRDLIANGQMQYLFDGRKGSILDWSGKGLGAAAITGSPTWARTKRGFGAFTPAAGTNHLSPGNPAGVQLSSGTVFAVGARTESSAAGNYNAIVAKLNAYGLYFSQAVEPKVFGVYDFGAALWRASTFSEGLTGRIHFYAMTFQSGVANGTCFYVDGVAYGTTTLTIVNQLSNLNIGWGIAAGQGLGGPVLLAGVASRILTPADISECWDEFLSQGFVLDVQHRRGVKAKQRDMSDADYNRQGIFFDTDGRRLPGGLVRDLSPGGYNGTVVGVPVPGADGEGIKFAEADYVNFGNVTQMNNAPKASWVGEFSWPTTNFVAARYLWNRTVDGTHGIYLYNGGAGATTGLTAWVANGANSYGYTATDKLRAGCKQHVMVLFDGAGATDADRLKLIVDGDQITLTFSAVPIPATLADMSAVNYTLGRTATTQPHTTTRNQFRNQVMSAGEWRAVYARWAQKLIWQAPGEDIPVSLVAAVPAGQHIGPWRLVGDSFICAEASTGKRSLRHVGGGHGAVALAQPHPFGTYTFSISIGAGAVQEAYAVFIASQPGPYSTAGQNGYMLYCNGGIPYLFRLTAGVAVLIGTGPAGSIVVNTTYDFCVARRPSDCRFTVYARGGAWGRTWTQIIQVADTNHTTSAWFNFGSNVRVDSFPIHDPTVPGNPGHPRIYQGQLDPTKQEVF